MTDKPDLATEHDMTPEAIAANSYFSREEKLGRLRDMKRELGRHLHDDNESLDTIEDRMAAINAAVAEVKREQAEDGAGVAMGRAPSA